MARMARQRRRWAPIVTVALLGALMSPGAPGLLAGGEAQPASLRYVQGGCRILGPFPTLREANEAAGEARSHGFAASAYRNSEGYHVRVC